MKKFIAVLALSFSAIAAADSVKIFETRDSMVSLSDVTNTFQVNRELGRAWVNVSIAERSGDDTWYNDTRVKVEGLAMNAEKTAIVYEANGSATECATVSPKRGLFGTNLIIRPTGACKFETKKAKIDVDNGFEIRRIPMIQVYLNVQ